MGQGTPYGGGVYFSDDFDTPYKIADISVAEDAVVTTTASATLAADDMVVLEPTGWSRAIGVYKIITKTDDKTFALGGLDTTSPLVFNANVKRGGTIKKIKSWLEIPQIVDIETSAGEPKYITVPYVFTDSIKIPNGFEPTDVVITVAHDPAEDSTKKISSISMNRKLVAVRITSTNCETYGYGYMTVRSMPTIQEDEINRIPISLAFTGQVSNYSYNI